MHHPTDDITIGRNIMVYREIQYCHEGCDQVSAKKSFQVPELTSICLISHCIEIVIQHLQFVEKQRPVWLDFHLKMSEMTNTKH